MNDDTYPPSATDARLHERRRLMHLCPLARVRAEWLTAPSARPPGSATARSDAQRHECHRPTRGFLLVRSSANGAARPTPPSWPTACLGGRNNLQHFLVAIQRRLPVIFPS